MISCETSAITEAEAKFRYNPKTNDSTYDPYTAPTNMLLDTTASLVL